MAQNSKCWMCWEWVLIATTLERSRKGDLILQIEVLTKAQAAQIHTYFSPLFYNPAIFGQGYFIALSKYSSVHLKNIWQTIYVHIAPLQTLIIIFLMGVNK